MTQRKTPFSKERLLDALEHLPEASIYWVGFSGGADSTALLHALCNLKSSQSIEIKAIHVNHGLHADANTWQSHCEDFCSALGIELLVHQIAVNRRTGRGTEAEARHQRYGIVTNIVGKGEMFLTAHHMDDQAETLLLNLVRGSGVDGLAGMPQLRPLGDGMLARPLLNFSMPSLRHYLVENGLDWLEDPSNQDQSYDRNFVRQSVIPMIEQRWPGASERLARSAGFCRTASSTLAAWADESLSPCLRHRQILDLTGLDLLDARFGFIVRHWLNKNRAPSLPARRLQELCRQANQASPQSRVALEWEGWVIQLFKNHLWLQPQTTIAACPELEWNGLEPLNLGSVIGTLELHPGMVLKEPVRVSQKHRGESIQIAHGGGHRQLKDILRESGIPPWLRPSVPVIRSQGEVLAAGDWIISRALGRDLSENRSHLRWTPSDTLLDYVHQQCTARAVDRT